MVGAFTREPLAIHLDQAIKGEEATTLTRITTVRGALKITGGACGQN